MYVELGLYIGPWKLYAGEEGNLSRYTNEGPQYASVPNPDDFIDTFKTYIDVEKANSIT
jgi:hypothetical protein